MHYESSVFHPWQPAWSICLVVLGINQKSQKCAAINHMSATSTCRWFVIFLEILFCCMYFIGIPASVMFVNCACCDWLTHKTLCISFTENLSRVCKGLRHYKDCYIQICELTIFTYSPTHLKVTGRFFFFFSAKTDSKGLLLAERISNAWWPLHAFGSSSLFLQHTQTSTPLHTHRAMH